MAQVVSILQPDGQAEETVTGKSPVSRQRFTFEMEGRFHQGVDVDPVNEGALVAQGHRVVNDLHMPRRPTSGLQVG